MDTADLNPHARVTADSVDPEFAAYFIEIDEWRDAPVRHRYVHGGFTGTAARFSFYFPPPDQYRGRFFHNTYPMAVSADIGPFPIAFEVATGDLGFTVASGAYYVQTNNGGVFRAAGTDPSIAAFRVNAAAAKVSRVIAADIYGDHRPYGYLFGGSGGAYQTMGAAENTDGVWDGFVPFVPGCNHAIPSMFTVRMHALRILRQRGKLAGIADALAPGGSGDPYAGLDEAEAAAFREVSQMGYPLAGWYGHETLDSGYFANISGMMPVMDPGYADNFWTQPGYLGSNPDDPIHTERFAHETTVTAAHPGPPFSFDLADVPDRDCRDAHLYVVSGAAAGASLPIRQVSGNTAALIMTADPGAAGAIAPGDAVRIDNSWTLALQTYHRHQVPQTRDYYGWDQFRDSDGDSGTNFPQRPVQIGPVATANSAGSVLEGRVHGKVLMLAALTDIDSFPWQADWYRGRVEDALGPDFHDNFVLWFIDNAHHENPMTPLQRNHVVSYGGALQQALRDLALWVEQGVRPQDTRYQVFNSQIVIPGTAAQRRGVQPVVTLRANGSQRADVRPGQPVEFAATVEAPPGTGPIIAAEWDWLGSGDFVPADMGVAEPGVRITASRSFDTPGTYFVALRATSQREGDAHSPYGRVQNLARVRVVVN